MKLYDYSKRRSKSKDIQFDQLDEEIRRIWDVLYNKRQQYQNQTFDPITGIGLTDAKSKDGIIRHIKFYPNGTNGFQFNFGTTSGTGNGGAINNIEGEYTGLSAASTLNAFNTVRLISGKSTLGDGGIIKFRDNPYFRVWVRTGSVVTNERLHVGYILQGNGSPTIRFCGFQFDDDVHPKWNIRYFDGTTYSINEPLGATDVSPNTQYVLEFQMVRTSRVNSVFDILANVYEIQVDTNGFEIKSGEEAKFIQGASINDGSFNQNDEIEITVDVRTTVAGVPHALHFGSADWICFKAQDPERVDPYNYVKILLSNTNFNFII